MLAKPSNSWENREQERRKNYSKAVSFHGRSAKSDDDEEDSDKNSDNERRKSDFNSIAARDRRRLKGVNFFLSVCVVLINYKRLNF